MANYFINSATGADSGTGANTAGTAYYTLKYAIETANGAPANGDNFYVDYAHVEDFTATVYGTAGSETIDLLPAKTNYVTAAGPLNIISTDFSVGSGTQYRPMTGKIENGNGSLTFQANLADGSADPTLHVRFIGIKFRTSAASVGIIDPGIYEFNRCTFAFGTNINTQRFRTDGNSIVTFNNCLIDFESNAVQTFIVNSATDILGTITLNQCTFANIHGTPTISLFDLNGYVNPTGFRNIAVHDCDLSGFNSLFIFNEDQNRFDIRFNRCKMKDTWANMESNNNFGDATYFSNSNVKIACLQCSNTNITATPSGLSYFKSGAGSIEHVTSDYYTASPASDGENNYSWKLSPTTQCNISCTLGDVVPLSIRHPGGNSVLRIRVASNFSALTDGELFAEIHAPGHSTITGSATIGNYISTRAVVGASTSQLNTRTVSPQNATETFSSTSHGFVNHQRIWFKSTTSLPDTIVEGKVYYVRDSNTNDFKVAETPGGTAVSFTTDGSGTITAYPLLVSGSSSWTGTGSVTGYSIEVPVYATEPGTVEATVYLAKANSGSNEKTWIHPELELF